MFSNKHGKSHGHGKPKKESNTKKHHIRTWIHSKKKKKHEANLFTVIMSSGEPSSPAQASISTTSFDVLDDARLVNSTITSQPAKPSGDNTDTEAIEEAVPIVQTTLPMPESKPEIEKNGLDVDTKKSPDEPDVSCLINCIYYTQQCCDCTIV
ncbi:uncharacterized protein [Anoplolepis gracilipes]|uniref:uncharacterized protein isoform X1 n=1 Tax=Anoplolepis gracilipes TaxID=354296 RepID=UPI003B9DF5B4